MVTLLRGALREYRGGGTDSRRWSAYRPRPGDIVVATYPKVGSTWLQRLVDMLIHQSTAPRPIMETYPWLDGTLITPLETMLATLDAQSHRRSIKSHVPFDALPIFDGVRYLHIARDGRDACFSQHNHQLGLSDAFKQRIAAARGPGAKMQAPPRPPEDPRAFFLQWLADAEVGGGPAGMLSFFDFEMTFWRERQRPNLLLLHYNDLKADLRGEIARMSAFLGVDTPDDLLTEMAEAGSFSAMKAAGEALLPKLGERFDRGHDRFLNKGTNGRWRDVLTADDLARYAALAEARLSPAAAAWLERGRLAAGDPRDATD